MVTFIMKMGIHYTPQSVRRQIVLWEIVNPKHTAWRLNFKNVLRWKTWKVQSASSIWFDQEFLEDSRSSWFDLQYESKVIFI